MIHLINLKYISHITYMIWRYKRTNLKLRHSVLSWSDLYNKYIDNNVCSGYSAVGNAVYNSISGIIRTVGSSGWDITACGWANRKTPYPMVPTCVTNCAANTLLGWQWHRQMSWIPITLYPYRLPIFPSTLNLRYVILVYITWTLISHPKTLLYYFCIKKHF